jgi:hypothetical protein
MMQYAQANCQEAQAIYAELKPLPELIGAGGLATTVTARLELLGRRRGDPRRPSLPLDDEGRGCPEEVADPRLTAALSATRFSPAPASPESYLGDTKKKLSFTECLWFFSAQRPCP